MFGQTWMAAPIVMLLLAAIINMIGAEAACSITSGVEFSTGGTFSNCGTVSQPLIVAWAPASDGLTLVLNGSYLSTLQLRVRNSFDNVAIVVTNSVITTPPSGAPFFSIGLFTSNVVVIGRLDVTIVGSSISAGPITTQYVGATFVSSIGTFANTNLPWYFRMSQCAVVVYMSALTTASDDSAGGLYQFSSYSGDPSSNIRVVVEDVTITTIDSNPNTAAYGYGTEFHAVQFPNGADNVIVSMSNVVATVNASKAASLLWVAATTAMYPLSAPLSATLRNCTLRAVMKGPRFPILQDSFSVVRREVSAVVFELYVDDPHVAPNVSVTLDTVVVFGELHFAETAPQNVVNQQYNMLTYFDILLGSLVRFGLGGGLPYDNTPIVHLWYGYDATRAMWAKEWLSDFTPSRSAARGNILVNRSSASLKVPAGDFGPLGIVTMHIFSLLTFSNGAERFTDITLNPSPIENIVAQVFDSQFSVSFADGTCCSLASSQVNARTFPVGKDRYPLGTNAVSPMISSSVILFADTPANVSLRISNTSAKTRLVDFSCPSPTASVTLAKFGIQFTVNFNLPSSPLYRVMSSSCSFFCPRCLGLVLLQTFYSPISIQLATNGVTDTTISSLVVPKLNITGVAIISVGNQSTLSVGCGKSPTCVCRAESTASNISIAHVLVYGLNTSFPLSVSVEAATSIPVAPNSNATVYTYQLLYPAVSLESILINATTWQYMWGLHSRFVVYGIPGGWPDTTSITAPMGSTALSKPPYFPPTSPAFVAQGGSVYGPPPCTGSHFNVSLFNLHPVMTCAVNATGASRPPIALVYIEGVEFMSTVIVPDRTSTLTVSATSTFSQRSTDSVTRSKTLWRTRTVTLTDSGSRTITQSPSRTHLSITTTHTLALSRGSLSNSITFTRTLTMASSMTKSLSSSPTMTVTSGASVTASLTVTSSVTVTQRLSLTPTRPNTTDAPTPAPPPATPGTPVPTTAPTTQAPVTTSTNAPTAAVLTTTTAPTSTAAASTNAPTSTPQPTSTTKPPSTTPAPTKKPALRRRITNTTTVTPSRSLVVTMSNVLTPSTLITLSETPMLTETARVTLTTAATMTGATRSVTCNSTACRANQNNGPSQPTVRDEGTLPLQLFTIALPPFVTQVLSAASGNQTSAPFVFADQRSANSILLELVMRHMSLRQGVVPRTGVNFTASPNTSRFMYIGPSPVVRHTGASVFSTIHLSLQIACSEVDERVIRVFSDAFPIASTRGPWNESMVSIASKCDYSLSQSLNVPVTDTLTQSATHVATASKQLTATKRQPVTATHEVSGSQAFNTTVPVFYEDTRFTTSALVAALRFLPQFHGMFLSSSQRAVAAAALKDHCGNMVSFYPFATQPLYVSYVNRTNFNFSAAAARMLLQGTAFNPTQLHFGGPNLSPQLNYVLGSFIGNVILSAATVITLTVITLYVLWPVLGEGHGRKKKQVNKACVVVPITLEVVLFAYMQPVATGAFGSLAFLNNMNRLSASTGGDVALGIIMLLIACVPLALGAIFFYARRRTLANAESIQKLQKLAKKKNFSNRNGGINIDMPADDQDADAASWAGGDEQASPFHPNSLRQLPASLVNYRFIESTKDVAVAPIWESKSKKKSKREKSSVLSPPQPPADEQEILEERFQVLPKRGEAERRRGEPSYWSFVRVFTGSGRVNVMEVATTSLLTSSGISIGKNTADALRGGSKATHLSLTDRIVDTVERVGMVALLPSAPFMSRTTYFFIVFQIFSTFVTGAAVGISWTLNSQSACTGGIVFIAVQTAVSLALFLYAAPVSSGWEWLLCVASEVLTLASASMSKRSADNLMARSIWGSKDPESLHRRIELLNLGVCWLCFAGGVIQCVRLVTTLKDRPSFLFLDSLIAPPYLWSKVNSEPALGEGWLNAVSRRTLQQQQVEAFDETAADADDMLEMEDNIMPVQDFSLQRQPREEDEEDYNRGTFVQQDSEPEAVENPAPRRQLFVPSSPHLRRLVEDNGTLPRNMPTAVMGVFTDSQWALLRKAATIQPTAVARSAPQRADRRKMQQDALDTLLAGAIAMARLQSVH